MAEPARALDTQQGSERFRKIRQDLLSAPKYLCPERPEIITEYFKTLDDPADPMVVRKAKALRHLLTTKSVKIWPDELIVGNVGSKRRSVMLHPEMAGVFLSEELLWLDKRKTAPIAISWSDRLKLATKVIPYWLTRNMVTKAFSKKFGKMAGYTLGQLTANYYLINEANGIGHHVPSYDKVISMGISGYLDLLKGKDGPAHEAMRIAGDGLVAFANRLSEEARRLASEERDPTRAAELTEIAATCAKVPLHPAETFREALQALWLTHLAVNLEGLNSAISFGRVDQYLYPYYMKDISEGRITKEEAKELLLCFAAKTDEHFYLLSSRISEYHGGLLMVQGLTFGGVDREGNDAVNELSYLILDVIEEARLKEPNYQVRLHPGTPESFTRRVMDVARQGGGMPAIFNDEAAVAALTRHGYPLEEARDYAVVGCVELGLPGKSFFSTDAALMNLPICLELALNRGRRLKGGQRVGVDTPDPASFTGMDQVVDAFRSQVEHIAGKMIEELRIMEAGNRDYHPTPLTSMLIDGCIDSGKDVTSGGAMYNHSGVQGVGTADAADSLAAIDWVVFQRKSVTMAELVEALKDNFASSPKIRAELLNAPKFGSDHELPDGYANEVAQIFHTAVSAHRNVRGGPYVPGFYSDTCYAGFGQKTWALPSGRPAKEPLAASLSPCTGSERLGPTAVMNSVAKVDSSLAPNGYALNLRFDPHTLRGDKGVTVLSALVGGYFEQGGLEAQLNVVDHKTLEDARKHPGKYPDLLVRVAGYCAYFDDLPDSVKKEIISRTRLGG